MQMLFRCAHLPFSYLDPNASEPKRIALARCVVGRSASRDA